MLVPLGTAKADVTTFSNNNGLGTQGTLTSFIIKFTTANLVGSAFSLGNINIKGTSVANSDNITATLYNASSVQVGTQISGSYTSDTNFDLSGIGLFGNNTTDGYWLQITGLDTTKYNVGDAAALTRDDTGSAAAQAASFVTALGGSTDEPALDTFSIASFTASVPEPATMILTGSALAVGAIGAYFKRRRKPQTEIAA